jgi:hypothetical protein
MYVENLVGTDTVNTVPPRRSTRCSITARFARHDPRGRRRRARDDRRASASADLALRRHRAARRRRREVVRRLVQRDARRDRKQAREAAQRRPGARRARAGRRAAGAADDALDRSQAETSFRSCGSTIRRRGRRRPSTSRSSSTRWAGSRSRSACAQTGELREFAQGVRQAVRSRRRARHGRQLARARRPARDLRQSGRLPRAARARFDRPAADQALDESPRHRAHALHRRLEERHDDRTRGVLPLLLQRAQRVGRRGANAGGHFIAITDPGTPLGRRKRRNRLPAHFVNDPNIGGRYSALVVFRHGAGGARRLRRPRSSTARSAPCTPTTARRNGAEDSPGVRFGAAIGGARQAGRDKLTIVTHPAVAPSARGPSS